MPNYAYISLISSVKSVHMFSRKLFSFSFTVSFRRICETARDVTMEYDQWRSRLVGWEMFYLHVA